MSDESFSATFEALKAILEPLEPRLIKVHDEPANYYLDTPHILKNKKPLYFGSARLGRRYVSFHLMPVYLYPDLLEGMSDELAGRMQGKSCFNFKAPEPELFTELRVLTNRGFERYREAGYVS